MISKVFLTLKDYQEKVQEKVDQIAAKNKINEKIEVVCFSNGNCAAAGTGDKLYLKIVSEAQSIINEKYELKAEE